jgi:threonine aldolase
MTLSTMLHPLLAMKLVCSVPAVLCLTSSVCAHTCNNHLTQCFATIVPMCKLLRFLELHYIIPVDTWITNQREIIVRFLWEAGGISFHSQANVGPVYAHNGVHITAEEVINNIVEEDLHTAPTKVVSLENTLNGMIFPIEEIKRISEHARSRGIKMHLDGARLWNAHQETGVPLSEYGRYFDSMSLCLSKGVGAPIGSILVGESKFIRKSRHFRKLFGGGWRQAGGMAKVAKHCIENIVPTMPETHKLARRLAVDLQDMGVTLAFPQMTNMVFINTANAGVAINDILPALLRRNIKIGGNGTTSRLVLHHQINDEAVDILLDTMKDVIDHKKSLGARPISTPVSQQDAVKAYKQ